MAVLLQFNSHDSIQVSALQDSTQLKMVSAIYRSKLSLFNDIKVVYCPHV